MVTGLRNESSARQRADALLVAARSQERATGRLKIFLGPAPGVGKTYEMLQSAQARRREGIDVVVGVVETHGRAETMALLDDLELLPRKASAYRGQALDEMDLDALLERKPAIALVDELAHTNAPGSRHPKRFLDVEELLAAGIDVYTTLNIQHVESLNDVVAQITRIRVRETVPDRILDRADDIELIDITPDDLIRRLKDGKVYVAKHAERALKHYFSPGNLTALRELALRRTAQRVDAQLLTHMQSNAIAGPWAAGERLIVCIGEDPRSESLIRHAKRLADYLHAPWTALCVETRRSLEASESSKQRVTQAIRLAQTLGGETATIPSASRRIADDVIAFARQTNATQVVVGKSDRSRWFEIVNGSVVHDLVRRAGDIGIHVVSGRPADPVRAQKVQTATTASGFDAIPFVSAFAAVAIAVGFAAFTQPLIGVESVDLVLLTAVVGIAAGFGLWPSLFAVSLASLAYNYFFLPPLYTFTIADPTNVAALFFFALVAILVSNLAARARFQTLAAQTRARTTEALYSFSRKLASCPTIDDVLWTTAYQMAALLKVRVVLLLEDENTVVVRAGYPPEDTLDEADLAAAQWAYANNTPAGRGADTLPGAKRLFQPMRTGRGTIGVAGLDNDRSGPVLTPEESRLFDALSDLSALAVERVRLVEDLDRAKLSAETDRLRQALLTSISHDLKTPLAGILGAASGLRDLDRSLSTQAKADLTATIIEESERLNRFIANLLDMTRLESGAVTPNSTFYDVGEIVGSALRRATAILAMHRVEVDLDPTFPWLKVDAVLFEQVLFNLLDNAAKYADAHSFITIRCFVEGLSLMIVVMDEGPGIPPAELEAVFDKFYRSRKLDSVRAGTGLGLAISRGFVEAMGGTIVAANRRDTNGAVFTIAFPLAQTKPRVEAE